MFASLSLPVLANRLFALPPLLLPESVIMSSLMPEDYPQRLMDTNDDATVIRQLKQDLETLRQALMVVDPEAQPVLPWWKAWTPQAHDRREHLADLHCSLWTRWSSRSRLIEAYLRS